MNYDEYVQEMKQSDGEKCVKVGSGMFRWWYVWDGELKRVTGSRGIVKDIGDEAEEKAKHDLGVCRHTSPTLMNLEDTEFNNAEDY